MRALLASLAILAGTASAQQLDPNITRVYYLGDLENCPGKLDMQPGDLWTLTFPDTVNDAFVTRAGVVERQIQGNRLIMAVTAQTGTTPVLVLTEDGQAPRFNITVTAGKGGRNKNVLIRPGLPPGGSKCTAAQATPAPAAAVKPPATPTVVKPSPAPTRPLPATVTVRAPVSVTTAAPAGKPLTPASATAVKTTPAPGTPAVTLSSAAAPTVPALPTAPAVGAWTAASAPASRPVTPPLAPAPSRPAGPVTVAATAPGYLRVKITTQPGDRTHLKVTITNTLDADVVLNEADLLVDQTRSAGTDEVIVPAGAEVTSDIQLTGPLPDRVTRLTWTGVVLGSGEHFDVRALLPVSAAAVQSHVA